MEIESICYEGTRILIGNQKRILINRMIEILKNEMFEEIQIPNIQCREIYDSAVEENGDTLFNFIDRRGRNLCLAPEYTAVIRRLSKMRDFKNRKDVPLFYVQECFRGGVIPHDSYRQFTQLGVEIVNPSIGQPSYLTALAKKLIMCRAISFDVDQNEFASKLEVNTGFARGLNYYSDGGGFEISHKSSNSFKQICDGGEYDGGVGFNIDIDKLLSVK